MKQHLIVFTRYPEPGKTKTRLIPALGAEGAANFQRQMTEYTLSEVKKLQQTSNVSCEIRFAGGDRKLMSSWLGEDLIYYPQGEGDLGDRMSNSFSDAFAANAQQVIIIGIDCPDLTDQILAIAFNQLNTSDLVLGPAEDGGYYLIGLCRKIPELFVNIDWGTNLVFQQTMDIAQKLGVSISQLPVLADVDRPEDLEKREWGMGSGEMG